MQARLKLAQTCPTLLGSTLTWLREGTLSQATD